MRIFFLLQDIFLPTSSNRTPNPITHLPDSIFQYKSEKNKDRDNKHKETQSTIYIPTTLVGSIERTPLDVRVDDRGVRDLALDISWDTGGSGTLSTLNTGSSSGLVKWVGAVEPEHVGRMIIPNRQSKNHSLSESITELLHSTLLSIIVGVAERSLGSSAESIGDRVSGSTSNVGSRVGIDDAILLVFPADLNKIAVRGTVLGDELRDDGELGVGVDRLALAVERGVAHAVAVIITTVLVADTVVAVGVVSALGTGAAGLASGSARMRGVGGGHVVRFPDVHLVAAGSVTTASGIDVGGGRLPVEHVGLRNVSILISDMHEETRWEIERDTNLAVNELHVMGALSITISSSVLGSSLVCRVLGHTTISVHSCEVESTVKSTSQVGNIDIEGKLLVLQAEQLVFGIGLHEVDSASDVLLCSGSHKLERKGVTGAVDSVSSGVVGSLHGAVSRTCRGVRAESGIPCVSGVAVGEARGRVEPAPVRVKNDLGLLGGASAGGTLLSSQGRMGFGLVGSNLLAVNASEDREDDGDFAVHREEDREEDRETEDEEGGYEWRMRRMRMVVVVRKEKREGERTEDGPSYTFPEDITMAEISIAIGGSL